MNTNPRLAINSHHFINTYQNELCCLNNKTSFAQHKLMHAFYHGPCICVNPMMLWNVEHLDKIKQLFHAFIINN